MRVESATVEQQQIGTILWDLTKFYDLIDWSHLILLALSLGFPAHIIVRVAPSHLAPWWSSAQRCERAACASGVLDRWVTAGEVATPPRMRSHLEWCGRQAPPTHAVLLGSVGIRRPFTI